MEDIARQALGLASSAARTGAGAEESRELPRASL